MRIENDTTAAGSGTVDTPAFPDYSDPANWSDDMLRRYVIRFNKNMEADLLSRHPETLQLEEEHLERVFQFVKKIWAPGTIKELEAVAAEGDKSTDSTPFHQMIRTSYDRKLSNGPDTSERTKLTIVNSLKEAVAARLVKLEFEKPGSTQIDLVAGTRATTIIRKLASRQPKQ